MGSHVMVFTGLNELQRGLVERSRLEEAKMAVKKHGARLQQGAQKNAPVGTPESTGIPGYLGGTLRQSIGLSIEDGGLTAHVEATAHYAGYVELGTRFMRAQPYMKPAFNQVKGKFNADLRKLVR